MSESKPKISLKERMKGKAKAVTSFEPTQNPPEPTPVTQSKPEEPPAQPAQQTPVPQMPIPEEMKPVLELYNQITQTYNACLAQLQKFAGQNYEQLSQEQQGEVVLIQWKIYALTSEKFNFKTLKKLYDELDSRDFFVVLEYHKMLTKYTAMQTAAQGGSDWAASFREYERLLDRNFNWEADLDEEGYNDTGIYKNPKAGKKKKDKAKPKPPPVDLSAPLKPIAKPIAFKKEEEIDIESLRVDGQSKGLKIFDADKEPLVAIFIGHVDAGKSTICGSILFLSGKVNELEINKYKEEAKANDRESWYVAYVMDINEEEKERGKTVEMGRAAFETNRKRFTLLDCPGHRNYVQNMISGAAQADVANLVISAKPGEFESGFEKDGQTREHAMLAKSLGAEFLVVIINKLDTVNWSEDRFTYIRDSLWPFLTKNCGYDPQNLFFVPLSGQLTLNMKERVSPALAPWYKGPSLWETFDSLPRIERSKNEILRIPILDRFKDKGVINTYSKIASGLVKPNMSCILMPTQRPVTISKILDIEDNELGFAGVGESVNLLIKGVEEDELRRGYVICGQQFWTHVCEVFQADVTLFDLPSNQFFGVGFTAMMHLHTILEEVEITKIWTTRPVDGVEKNVAVPGLKSGEKGGAEFKIRKPVCLEKYAEFRELGRFALRKETITLASGKITRLKPVNPEMLKKNAFFMQAEGKGAKEDGRIPSDKAN